MAIARPPSRLLRHTLGTTETLAKNAAHQLAARHALVHYRSGAVFTFIPKNACTSLRVSLAIANGTIADTSDWTWVHANNSTFSATLPELARASVTAVILRCPFRRLASVYLDKIVSRSPEIWGLYRRTGYSFDHDRFTFRDFVTLLSNPALLRSDIHWRPQIHFLAYQGYDHVCSMEDLTGFADFFRAITGQQFVDARPFSGHTTSDYPPLEGDSHADTPLIELQVAKSRGQLPRAEALFDEELVAQASRIYTQDLQLFRDLIGTTGLAFPEIDGTIVR